VPEGGTSMVDDRAARYRVLIVDDHKIVREGLACLMQFEPDIDVVGQAEDGPQAVQLSSKLRPDAVIMDVNLGEMSGLEATKRIMAENPGIKVIGLSMYGVQEVGTAFRDAGAAACLAKGGPTQDLLAAIRAVCR
jgi:DNA-binding NarL/FixJ family response regulator